MAGRTGLLARAQPICRAFPWPEAHSGDVRLSSLLQLRGSRGFLLLKRESESPLSLGSSAVYF